MVDTPPGALGFRVPTHTCGLGRVRGRHLGSLSTPRADAETGPHQPTGHSRGLHFGLPRAGRNLPAPQAGKNLPAMLAAAVGGVLTATLGAPAVLGFNALTFLAVAALLGSAPLPAGAGSAALGVVLGAWGVGMIAGGALVGRIRRRVGLAALLIGAAVAEAAAFLGMGLSASVAEVAAFAALGGVGNGLEGVLFMTAVQERVSDAYQARVSGLVEALMTAAVGVGFLTGGTIAALAGARATYLTAGLGGLAVVAWTLARLRAPAEPRPATGALVPA